MNSFSPDIGEGWVIAVIDSAEELEFIRMKQMGLSNDKNYWIGGTADELIGEIDYETAGVGRKRTNITVLIIVKFSQKIKILCILEIEWLSRNLDNNHLVVT